MRTLQVSKNNQIAKFILSIREKTGTDYLPFPSDICELTRVFLLYLAVYSTIVFFLCSVVTSIISFWVYLSFFGMPPDTGSFIALFLSFGLIFSISIIGMSLFFGFQWVIDRYSPFKRVSGALGKVVNKIPSVEEESVLYAMWTSFKDKVCFKVELKDD